MHNKPVYEFFKRIMDIICALLGIFGTSPLWIIGIVGIIVSDPGPIFYMANRVGKNNKTFKMFKFRSMRVDKSANEKGFKADTNRIFAFGEFIRRSKIDELPQLLNILFGDMSVVGPRPASVDQVNIVRAGKYAITSSVLPGLTGPSALYDYIYGDRIEDEEEYREKVLPTRLSLDIEYVKNRCFCYDINLIIMTVLSILKTILGISQEKLLKDLIKKSKTIKGDYSV